jgi:hypothetical protein
VCAATLVAVILFVPPLVRATQHFDRGTTPSPLRLNRGFDAPEAKCHVAPPDDLSVRSVVLEDPRSGQVVRRSSAVDEPTPDLPLGSSPDPLRGPPLSHIA